MDKVFDSPRWDFKDIMENYLPTLNVSSAVEKLLADKKIYYTFAYGGQLRFYKHNQLIWYASAPCTKNQWGGWTMDMNELVKKGNECIEFFIKNGYIPNMETQWMTIPELEKGWLTKQVETTLEEMKSWPNWMKMEIEIRGKQVSTECKEK